MKNFFKGISFTQVLAGSLAAVTAFLLSSKIGIAGSVIGVAMGSIVSAVASQLYQNVIHASSKKIQSSSALKSGSSRYEEDDTKVVNNARFIALEDDMPKEYEVYNNMGDSSKEKQARRVVAMASNANAAGDSSNSQNAKLGKSPALSAESTSVMELSSLRKLKEEDNALSEGDEDSILTLNDAKRALGGRSDYANSEAKYKKLTIVIAILSALAAVLLTAGIVLLFTQGKGTDNLVPSGQNTEQDNGQNPNNQMRQNSQNNGVQNQDKNSQDAQKDSQDAQDEKDSKDSKDSKDGENSSSKNPSEKQDKKTNEGSSSSLDSNESKADFGEQSSVDSGVSGADPGARGSKGDSSVSGDSSPSSPSTSTNGVSGGSSAQQGESGSQQSSSGE